MPFTLSHAAAVLPFRGFKPIWPALVIGTFAPDMQYFISLSNDERTWHRFPQVLLFAIPFGLISLWVFEHTFKAPVVKLLPNRVQQRLQHKLEPLSFAGSKQFLSIVLWIAVGIATHLVWDQFTHTYEWLPSHWALLQTTLRLPVGRSTLLAHFLQYVSSLGGFLVLCLWFAKWYRRTPPVPLSEQYPPRLKFTLVGGLVLAALLAGYPLALIRLASHARPIPRHVFVTTVFEAVTLVFCIELLIYSISLSLAGRSRRVSCVQPEEGD